MKVAEAIADALATESNGVIFGVMGDANMAVWGALTANPHVRMIPARHEEGAVAMADGYAAATGRIGVAMVTCGPGLTNTASALLTAARQRTPLVVFTGSYIPVGKGALQSLDQKRFAEACESGYRSLNRMDALADDIREGFYMALTQSRPVILDLDSQYWDADLKWDWEYCPAAEFVPPLDPAPQPEAVERLAELLMKAERPVIIAGRGARASGARADLERLGERLGALLATSLLAKGFFDGHPYDLGVSGSFSSAPSEKLLADADVVVGFGASMNFYTTEGGLLFPQAKVARVDVRPAPPEIGFIPGLYVQGDAKKTALALLRTLEQKGVQTEGYRTAATRDILKTPIPQPPRATDGLDPRELMRVLAGALPRNTQIVSGAGHYFYWPNYYLPLPPGGTYYGTMHFGCIGLALAEGIGAAIGNPERPTLIIEGDGGLLQSVQELHAAAEAKVPLVLLLMNDGGYGAEVHKMGIKKLNPRDATWRSPDWVAIARAFGCDGLRLEKEADLAGAVKEGFESKRLFLIDARVSPAMMNDGYQRVHLGQEKRVPLLRPVQS